MEGIATQDLFAVRVGRWWFKNRSVSPLPLFALMLALPPERQLTFNQIGLAILGIALAESLRLWAVGYAGSATRTRGTSVPQLVHAGPYRHVRNPLYVANIALYTFCGLLFGFTYLALAIFIFSCVQYTFIVAFEEDTLERTFGTPYIQYKEKVPRWLFTFSPAISGSEHFFDLARAFRSERSTLVSISVMGTIFALKQLVLI